MGRISDALKKIMGEKKETKSAKSVKPPSGSDVSPLGTKPINYDLDFPKILFGDVDSAIFCYYEIAEPLIEEYKHLIASLSNTGAKLWLVTSSLPGEGKTVFSLNLAMLMAKILDNKRILYVDADMRAPKSGLRYLDVPETKLSGLTEVVEDVGAVKDVIVGTEIKGFYMLPRGREVKPEIFSNEKFELIFPQLKGMFDYIFVDTSPVKSFVDTRLIAPYMDAVLMLVRMNKTPRGSIKYAVQILEDAGVERKYFVLNGVMNYLPKASVDKYYRY